MCTNVYDYIYLERNEKNNRNMYTYYGQKFNQLFALHKLLFLQKD